MSWRPLLRVALALAPCASAFPQCDPGVLTGDSPFDRFGYAAALSLEHVAVGAYWADECPFPGQACNSGAAYVYPRPALAPRVKLVAPDLSGGDEFGIDVALHGYTLVVGARGVNAGGVDSGAVYVYDFDGASWVFAQKLVARDPLPDVLFGHSVAIEGDRLVVGAPGGFFGPAGAAHVFERGSSGWSETHKLTSSDLGTGDYFGIDVALEDDLIAIGAENHDHSVSNEGAVYVFRRSGADWIEEAELLADPAVGNAGLGWAVSLDGSAVASGARGGLGAAWRSGAAYVFRSDSTGWHQEQEVFAVGGSQYDDFGFDVALEGDLLIVGARRVDEGAVNSGAAYTFRRIGATWLPYGKWTPAGLDDDSDFGVATEVLEGEVLVGAWQGQAAGQVFLVSSRDCVGTSFCACWQWGQPCSGQNVPVTEGCTNSTGGGARLAAVGLPSVAADDLVLRTNGLPPGENSILFMGPGVVGLIWVPVGGGMRCVQGRPYFRFPVAAASAAGVLVEGPGLVAFSHSHFGATGAISAGSTWYFQTWFQDPTGPCGYDAGLSNALAVTFMP